MAMKASSNGSPRVPQPRGENYRISAKRLAPLFRGMWPKQLAALLKGLAKEVAKLK